MLLLPFPLTSLLVNSTAHSCLKAALTPFELDNGQAQVGASVGIDGVQEQDDFVNALRRADQSMYQIKHTGKNGVAIGQTLLSINRTGTNP